MYCPRTTFRATSSSDHLGSASSTFTRSLRTASAERSTGGSIATRQRSCIRWFWTMSRSARVVMIGGVLWCLVQFRIVPDLRAVNVFTKPQRSEPRASERRERATRTERAGEAARERACGGVRGAKPSDCATGNMGNKIDRLHG